jgi:protoporphyrinogen oxidase
MIENKKVHIIGAGPAGLSAARELVGGAVFQVRILEKSGTVGGISRTEEYKGYRVDIGGHRFFTKNDVVNALWNEMLGADFLTVRRQSRIYHRGRFLHYPLQPWDTFSHLGPIESTLVCLSYLKAVLHPSKEEKTFEQWTINRFGKRLYLMFFKEYTEKVWGRPCSTIQADWAAQRIKGLSFSKTVAHAVLRTNGPKSLVESFQYPRLGPGMMWDRFRSEIVAKGGQFHFNCSVSALHHTNGTIHHLNYSGNDSGSASPTDHVISTMPLSQLVYLFDPLPPENVLRAAGRLLFRDFIIVVLIIRQRETFKDQWLYIHSPDVAVGRIQNFKNWSAEMVPNEQTTSLGMEYFCNQNDALWQQPDSLLIDMAAREMEDIGIARRNVVVDAHVIREAFAYPVYDETYRQSLEVLKEYVQSFKNLQTVGRNGMHRYNNMDHSMITGIQAAQNLKGDNHDPWLTDNEDEYFEESGRRN